MLGNQCYSRKMGVTELTLLAPINVAGVELAGVGTRAKVNEEDRKKNARKKKSGSRMPSQSMSARPQHSRAFGGASKRCFLGRPFYDCHFYALVLYNLSGYDF